MMAGDSRGETAPNGLEHRSVVRGGGVHPEHDGSVRSRGARWRVWAALVGAPLVLMVAFLPLIVLLAGVRGLRGDELVRAIEPLAPLPGALGFALIFALTAWLSGKDGLALGALGWDARARSTTRLVVDVAVGVVGAAMVVALDHAVLFPLLRLHDPSFEPSLPAVGLIGAVAMLLVAIAAEETLYRGYAWCVLRERHGTVVAVLVTSAAYALLTPGPGVGLKLWALSFGVVLALVRAWRGTLWSGAIVHGAASLAPLIAARL